ncbi:MAG TPA: hypothetical protein VNU93_02800, partial [Verrucomicrobiae bacterium]|nr:hypothetical protein [Verrucomicrobiae bacterium]
VFFSIMFGATYAFGFIATPVVFVLFILQLASSGGTFPIETAPWFFRMVSPFFPMTYTVEGLRMAIGGISYPRFTNIAIILACFLFTFLAGGYLVDRYLKGPRKLKAEAE